MEFANLYRENQEAVKRALKAMWCSDPHNAAQQEYAEQIEKLIDNELFTSNDYIPLVQCMDKYESIDPKLRNQANNLVGGLWKKPFDPYKHQYESWYQLDKGNSIVVTTGTGSGKTECFMLPLVHNLIQHPQEGKIQAIFLYPLNALMEDQKERLQELLDGTNLTFAVYNGNLPHDDGRYDRTANGRRKQQQVQAERNKYRNIVPTREELWACPPNIILTNPTMLEYMLLRNKDQHLFTAESLKWIVIDEAHTFTGAGAAELTMLIRRVLDAFEIQSPDEIRFATSSATIGNATSKAQSKQDIVKFISDLTGSSKVVPIDGDRKYTADPNDSPELVRCRHILNINDYISLDKLFPNPSESIEDKLNKLDQLCSGANPLKAKVHYFYRVPSNGLRVRLTDIVGKSLKVYSSTPLNVTGAPYLELVRCSHCGEYAAIADTVEKDGHKYKATSSSESDIFNFDSNNEKTAKLIFSYSDKVITSTDDTGTVAVTIQGDSFHEDKSNPSGWHFIQNVQRRCPCCGELLFGNKNSDDETDEIVNATQYRVSSGFISRLLAPSILPNLDAKRNAGLMHDGQQYISFVDSRQGAAKSTMQQNIEQEREWIYSRVYHKLTEMGPSVDPTPIIQKRARLAAADFSQEDIDSMCPLPLVNHLTWKDIYSLLSDDPISDELALQFANKREDSDEFDAYTQTLGCKPRYIYSAMIEQLAKRPRKAAAPETMGLFVSYYPKLEEIKELHQNIKDFNTKYPHCAISLEEWKHLLKMYLDTYVRSKESVYLKNGNGSDKLDIKNCCGRFGTTKPPRKPIHEPTIDDNKQGRYLAAIILIATRLDPNAQNINDVIYDNRDDLNKVLKAFWYDLTETTKLLQPSWSLDRNGDWVLDKDKDAGQGLQYRLNVADIAFKLYDTVWMCDTRAPREQHKTLRPYDTLFYGYSPYIIGGKAVMPYGNSEQWQPYPYLKGILPNGQKVTKTELRIWAKDARKILWDNNIWGENGGFTNKLEDIHYYPDIFIQAEHTAQVDKLIAKHSQERFKNREINILACSTTMEMGVDLGNLEMVVMTSIPPHPSNYKQRAGRSGRNDNPRSACITLCSSDSVGLRTLTNPMVNIIKRPMQAPFVDLTSPQVISRHANSYLFRLSKIFFNNARGNQNNLDQEIIEFFTPYTFDSDQHGRVYNRICDINGKPVYPCDRLGDERVTKYFDFLNFLDNCSTDPNNHLDILLKDTIFDSSKDIVIQICKNEIKRCYNELEERVDELAGAYNDHKDEASKDAKQAAFVKGDSVETGFGWYLRHRYSELLSKNLIEYFATNRFTPNANMPVNIVEFDMSSGQRKAYEFKSSNPSYPLQQAISQYSPGNTIILENRTSVVRGLLYTGMFKNTVTFKKIFSDGVNTVIGEERKGSLQALVPWPVNNRDELTMVEPYAFIPDINEDCSRFIEEAPYTQVSAQLIGASTWADYSKSEALISVRNNLDCGDANILYYNEGVGFGYCFCSNCGKTVLERGPGLGTKNMPRDMNNEDRDNNGQPEYYHYMINRKNKRSKVECWGRNKILRNIIIGGLIQTDYSEIRIRENHRDPWLSDRAKENLLITLGIVLTQCFVEKLGKDRSDVDFAITPNGHICVFDTNPGGSGYSNQLVRPSIMQSVIDAAKDLLDNISTKDELIDRYTKRYYEKIDIDAAKDWIENEQKSAKNIPGEVSQAYPNAQVASFEEIIEEIRKYGTQTNVSIFVDSDWAKWIYQDENIPAGKTWRTRVHDIRNTFTRKTLCICEPKTTAPRPIISTLSSINDWADIYIAKISLAKDIYPLAISNGKFFFTNQVETGTMDSNWARGNIFCTNVIPHVTLDKMSLDPIPTCIKFRIEDTDKKSILSTELADIVLGKIKDMYKEFKDHCAQCTSPIEFIYMDEHLKSATGIVTTLQFIEHIIKDLNRDYKLEFKVEEYTDKPTRTIGKNIGGHEARNKFLKGMTEEWIKDVDAAYSCNCIGNPVFTCEASGKFPHWRELAIRCGNKSLVLYPNGGLINGWYYDWRSDNNSITMDNISNSDEIPLIRHMTIMYDAEIMD